jgi:hypothetical protein
MIDILTDYSKQLIPIEWLIESYNTRKIKTLHSQTVAEIFQRDYPLDQLCRLYPAETQAMRKAYDDGSELNDKLGITNEWIDGFVRLDNEQKDSMFKLMIRMVAEHYPAHDQFTFMMAIC